MSSLDHGEAFEARLLSDPFFGPEPAVPVIDTDVPRDTELPRRYLVWTMTSPLDRGQRRLGGRNGKVGYTVATMYAAVTAGEIRAMQDRVHALLVAHRLSVAGRRCTELILGTAGQPRPGDARIVATDVWGFTSSPTGA